MDTEALHKIGDVLLEQRKFFAASSQQVLQAINQLSERLDGLEKSVTVCKDRVTQLDNKFEHRAERTTAALARLEGALERSRLARAAPPAPRSLLPYKPQQEDNYTESSPLIETRAVSQVPPTHTALSTSWKPTVLDYPTALTAVRQHPQFELKASIPYVLPTHSSGERAFCLLPPRELPIIKTLAHEVRAVSCIFLQALPTTNSAYFDSVKIHLNPPLELSELLAKLLCKCWQRDGRQVSVIAF